MTRLYPLDAALPLRIPDAWTQWRSQGRLFRRQEGRVEQYAGGVWWPLAVESIEEAA
jgi:hypothetical protein